MPTDNLSPHVFTKAVAPLTDFLTKKFKDGIPIVSDTRDRFGKQYVDLVQEGGGVHGIALAGYTYVLEKMNIGFMKMAGTSAGSINTLVLNAVYTKQEAEALGLSSDKYYETRSEKVLEYLANKPLTDMVDGHPKWRKLLLKIFTGSVGMGGFLKPANAVKRGVIWFALLLFLLIVGSLGLAIYREGNAIYTIIKWIVIISAVALLAGICWLAGRLLSLRLLYKHAERFGINPGDDFERWIEEDILQDNNIRSVTDLKKKLEDEAKAFGYRYETGYKPTVAERVGMAAQPPALQAMTDTVRDPHVKIDDLFDQMSVFLQKKREDELHNDGEVLAIMRAFEERLKAEDKGVTKELVIVSSDITHEIKVEFPGMHALYWGNDYNISPAKYVRASMSVPFFFKPYKIDFNAGQQLVIQKEWQRYMKTQRKIEPCALLVDGGMLSNFPINVFYNPKIPVPRKPTFGIRLEYEDSSAPMDIKSVMGFVGKLVSTMRFFYGRDFILKHDMYQKTVRSIDTGKIHWLNFNLTDQEKIELFFRGALSATIFLARHMITDTEIQELAKLGEKVSFNDSCFSIYGDGPCNFKTEDVLLENSTFEWQSYKIERLVSRLNRAEQKDELKGGAALTKTT